MLGNLSDTLVGTDLYATVRRATSSQSPVGHAAVREAEQAIAVLGVESLAYVEVGKPILQSLERSVLGAPTLTSIPSSIDGFVLATGASLMNDEELHRWLADERARRTFDESDETASGGNPGSSSPQDSPTKRRGSRADEDSPAADGMYREASIAESSDFVDGRNSRSGNTPGSAAVPPPAIRRNFGKSRGVSMGDLYALGSSVFDPDAAATQSPRLVRATAKESAFAAPEDGDQPAEDTRRGPLDDGADPKTASTRRSNDSASAYHEQHRELCSALFTPLTKARWLVHLCLRLLQSLGDMHYELSTVRASWSWLNQRGRPSRIFLALLTLNVFDRNALSVPDQVSLKVDALDGRVHKALTYLRVLESHIIETIGNVHGAVSRLQDAVDTAREALVMSQIASVADVATLGATVAASVDAACADAAHELLGWLATTSDPSTSSPSGGGGGGIPRQNSVLSAAAVTPLARIREVSVAAVKWVANGRAVLGQLEARELRVASGRLRGVFAAATVGVGLFTMWKLRNNPLAVFAGAAEHMREAFGAYVVSPARGLYESMVIEPPKPTDPEGVARERLLLNKLVLDYHQDKGPLESSEFQALSNAVESGDLGRVADDYRMAMRSPVWSLMEGKLIRLLLIQVQQQKVDVDAIMQQLNDSLVRNDLTMRMFACFPLGSMVLAARWYFTSSGSRRMKPLCADMRVCWWTLHRIMCGGVLGSGTHSHHHHHHHRQPGIAGSRRPTTPPRHLSATNRLSVGDFAAAGAPLHRVEPCADDDDALDAIQFPQRGGGGRRAANACNPMHRAPPPLNAAFDELGGNTHQADGGDSDAAGTASTRDVDNDGAVSASPGSRSTWGSELTAFEHGHVLLQVHALRTLSLLLWPSKRNVATRQRFLEDLHDLEQMSASRKVRLHVLDRMAVSYGFLRAGESTV